MTALLTDNLPLLACAPNGIKKLRELILELAMRGKLVEQNASDEPASELLKRIAAEKAQLVAEGKIKKQKSLMNIGEEEKPFDVPANWEWVRVAAVGHDWGQKTPDQEFTYIDVGSVDNAVGMISSPQVLMAEDAPSRARKVVRPGTVIYSTIRPYLLNIAVINEEYAQEPIASTAFAIIHPYLDMPSKYYLWYLRSPIFVRYVESVQMGIAYPAINDGQFFSGLIPLPPLAEQHRIVAKVDELMALCDRLEAQQADAASAHAQLVQTLLGSLTQASDATEFAANWQCLAEHFHTLFSTEPSIDALKQTLLQLAVMGKLVPQDPRDEPAESLLQRNGIKSQPHTLQGWAAAPLGQLGEILGGSTPSKANAEFWNGDIPWVSPKDMKRPVIHDSEDHISAKALAETSLKAVPAKSLLMVVRGMILVHSFPVALTAREVTINQDMKALVPPEEISAYLLMYLQATKAVMVGLVDRSSHGTCKLISEKLWSHIVCLPPLPEQHRIVAKVDQLMALCDQLKTRLTQARQLNEQLASTLVEQAVA